MAKPESGDANNSTPAPDNKSAGADADAGKPNPNAADGAGADDSSIISSADAGKDKGKPDEDAKPKDAKPQGAPEKYEAFKMPEGMPADEEATKQFSEAAKAAGLSQEQAQKVVDFYGGMLQQQQGLFKQMAQEWRAETLKALGASPEKELVHAAKARDAFFTPEAVKILTDSGLANHPEIVKAFIKIGKAIADDTVISGGQGGGEKTVAEMLYPNQGK
jgi:hypothetical protein